MKYSIERRGLTAAFALLLTGCAGMTPSSPITDIQAARETPAARPFHDAIELGGRLSVRYQGNRQE
ncbi:MAG: hypothetical protein ACREX0_05190, partial [Noviherbaspirillum sp.]